MRNALSKPSKRAGACTTPLRVMEVRYFKVFALIQISNFYTMLPGNIRLDKITRMKTQETVMSFY